MYLSIDRFRKAARADRKSVSGALVRKYQVLELGQADDAIRFTITTASVDRDNDRIALDGWDTSAYERAPVVLWGHDAYRPPIGRATRLFRDGDALKSDVQFIPPETPEFGPFAAGIQALCRGGYLYASSVGFRPLDWDFTEDKARNADDWFPGIDFKRQELMEWSIVSVPANPEALLEHEFVAASAPAAVPATIMSPEHLNATQAELLRAVAAKSRARFRRMGREIAFA